MVAGLGELVFVFNVLFINVCKFEVRCLLFLCLTLGILVVSLLSLLLPPSLLKSCDLNNVERSG